MLHDFRLLPTWVISVEKFLNVEESSLAELCNRSLSNLLELKEITNKGRRVESLEPVQ